MKGTPQQEAIWWTLEHDTCNLVVSALAGTGKTTTMIEGVKRLPRELKIAFVVFGSENAKELQQKVPAWIRSSTLHSLGGNAIARYNKTQLKYLIDKDKVPKMLPPQTAQPIRTAVIKLVSLAKATLVEPTNENLEDLAVEYEVDVEEKAKVIYNLVRMCLEKSKSTSSVDFDDMVWLPVVLGIKPDHFDLLIGDEAQDLNRAQQELMLMCADRIAIVGDINQAIYGFRGADTESMHRMHEMLAVRDRGCMELPLTYTWRCPKSHVALAKTLVPAYEAMPEAPEGELYWNQHPEYQLGDMVLCRTNAPLISAAYELIKRNVPVRVQGLDIGRNLAGLIKRLCDPSQTTIELGLRLSEWRAKETARLTSDPSKEVTNAGKLAAMLEKADCIDALSEGLEFVSDVLARINMVFSNVSDQNRGSFVWCASVHRAKGLESDVVHILRPDLMPHPMAKTDKAMEQERHIQYVAWTRSKNKLYIHGPQIGTTPEPDEAIQSEPEPDGRELLPVAPGFHDGRDKEAWTKLALVPFWAERVNGAYCEWPRVYQEVPEEKTDGSVAE